MSSEALKPLAKLSEYPYGTEFQLKLLALAFREPKFINEYEQVLAPTYFDTDEFKHLAKIALEHFRNYGQSIDTGLVFDAIDSYCRSNRFSEAVKDRLVNTFGKLVDEDLSSGEWVRDKALQFAQSQAVKEALVRGVRSIDDTENFPKIIADLESAIGMNAPKRSSVNFRDIAHEIPSILRETSVYSRANRIPTGIPTIDDAMFGGPARRKLGLIMAPSGVGKSHMLTNLGANAIRYGFSVFHFTFGDMEDIEVLVRYAGNFTGINTQNIFSGNGSNYDASIVEVLKSVSADLFVSTHPADTITTSQLNSMISRMIAQTGVKPGMVVVDYADNLATGMKYTSDPGEISARMGHTYQQLAKIAAKYDVLVWTGSQVKLPNWGDDIITNAGIARSVSKIEHVDYNITINQNQAEHEQNIARLFTAKTRFGKDKAIVPVHFDKSTSRITEMDESETEEFEVKRKDRAAPKKRRLATIKKQMDDGDDGEELPADEKKDLLASVLKKAIQ